MFSAHLFLDNEKSSRNRSGTRGHTQVPFKKEAVAEDTCKFCTVQEGNDQPRENKDGELTAAVAEMSCVTLG